MVCETRNQCHPPQSSRDVLISASFPTWVFCQGPPLQPLLMRVGHLSLASNGGLPTSYEPNRSSCAPWDVIKLALVWLSTRSGTLLPLSLAKNDGDLSGSYLVAASFSQPHEHVDVYTSSSQAKSPLNHISTPTLLCRPRYSNAI